MKSFGQVNGEFHLPSLWKLVCFKLRNIYIFIWLVCIWYENKDDGFLFQPIPKPVYKGLLSLLKAFVHGLEVTFQNYGIGGMASTYMVLEIAHTHHWARESMGSNKSDTSITPEVRARVSIKAEPRISTSECDIWALCITPILISWMVKENDWFLYWFIDLRNTLCYLLFWTLCLICRGKL